MTAERDARGAPNPRTFDYFDASDDPLARQTAATPAAVLDALESLGCVELGHALAVFRLNGVELVTPVWRSADARTQVELEARTGRADLTTLFADGTVVKTLQRPPWPQWIHVAPGVRHHPRDRHVCAAFPGTLGGVMARHRARVAELEAAGGVVVPATEMRVHFALRRRAAALRDARMDAQLTLAIVFAAALAVAASVLTLRALGDRPALAVALLATLAALLVGIPAHYASKWFVAPVIVRLRPGPPPRAADAMLAEPEVPTRRLRRG